MPLIQPLLFCPFLTSPPHHTPLSRTLQLQTHNSNKAPLQKYKKEYPSNSHSLLSPYSTMFEESIASAPSIWASIISWLTPSVLFLLLNLMIGTIAITSSFATHKPSSNDPQSHENVAHPQQNAHQLGRSPSVLQRLKSINFYHYRSQEPTSLSFEKHHDFTSTTTSHFSFQQETLQQDHYYQQQQQQTPPQQPPLTRSPSMLQRLRSINFYNYLSPLPKAQQPSQQEQAHYNQENDQEYEEEDEVQDQEHTLDEIYNKLKGVNRVVDRSMSDTKPSAGEKPAKLSKKMKKSASSKSTFSHFEEEEIVESRRPATVKEGTKGKLAEMDDCEVDAKADDFINKFKQQLKLQRLDSIMRYKELIGRGSGK